MISKMLNIHLHHCVVRVEELLKSPIIVPPLLFLLPLFFFPFTSPSAFLGLFLEVDNSTQSSKLRTAETIGIDYAKVALLRRSSSMGFI